MKLELKVISGSRSGLTIPITIPQFMIGRADEVLSDSQKRARYDQFGHAANDPNSGFGGFSGQGGFSDFDLGDIFESFFGGGFGGRTARTKNLRIHY